MKKLSLISLLILSIGIFAQFPNSFKYQAVVRNVSGDVLTNQDVSFRISILQGATSVYTETFNNETTNDFGLINLNIGSGTTSDDFSLINWKTGLYSLKVELDESGGTNYTEMGTSTLVAVPYAMYSKDVENKQILNFSNDTLYLTDGGQIYLGGYSGLWQQNDTNIFYNNGWVGVGTDNPTGMMVVQGDDGVDPDSALFEVKNKNGQTIFAVYDGGVRIYVDDNPAKASTDKGGFAVAGYRIDKSTTNEFLRVSPDSVRIYIKEDDGLKASSDKGGFAVAGYRIDKSVTSDYFNIGASDSTEVINPSEARILWYPIKEAFLTGRVLIESADSVGKNSMATGFESKAVGDYSQAMGYKALARGYNSTSIGDSAIADGINSYAFGSYVIASDTNAYAFGKESAALAKGSFVFGQGDTATAESAMALGYNNRAEGVASLALGAYTIARDTLSVAMGYQTISEGIASVAMGDATIASGDNSLALGSQTTASGETSTAMGNQTVASGISSIAMGHVSYATGTHAIAMGDSTLAANDNATSMGFSTVADGVFSTSMGYRTYAHGQSSFAIGVETTANGDASIAMGSNTIANGNSSLAIGNTTTASGEASAAIGINNLAQGDASVAYGISTNATTMASFVVGSFNDAFAPVNSTDLTSDIFVVANGVLGTPHNALTVLKMGYVGINTNTPDKLLTVDGDARVTGDIYYGPIITGIGTYNKPDFVFNKNYDNYFDITSIEKFIKKNKHLPWLTSAKDEKEGINMTRMSFETLEAVENQQLQIIDLNKKINSYEQLIISQQNIIDAQQKQLKSIEKRLKKLEK